MGQSVSEDDRHALRQRTWCTDVKPLSNPCQAAIRLLNARTLRAMAQRSEVAEGTDERLRELAEQRNSYGLAAELIDHGWHLVWVSEELMAMYLGT